MQSSILLALFASFTKNRRSFSGSVTGCPNIEATVVVTYLDIYHSGTDFVINGLYILGLLE
jgi:hypothetical protein